MQVNNTTTEATIIPNTLIGDATIPDIMGSTSDAAVGNSLWHVKVFQIAALLFVFCLFSFGVYRIVMINHQYPAYQTTYYQMGDKVAWGNTELTVNQMLICDKNELVNRFEIPQSDLDMFSYLEKNDDKYFYLLYINIKCIGDEELNVGGDLDFYIEGNYQFNGSERFTFDLINSGKDRIIKCGEEREFVYPFIFFEHFFKEDLREVIDGMKVSLVNCQYPYKTVIKLN